MKFVYYSYSEDRIFVVKRRSIGEGCYMYIDAFDSNYAYGPDALNKHFTYLGEF
jgi:hypothetical protein